MKHRIKQKPLKRKVSKSEALLKELRRAASAGLSAIRQVERLNEKLAIQKQELRALRTAEAFAVVPDRRNALETAARQEDVAHQKEIRNGHFEKSVDPETGEEIETWISPE